MPIHFSASSRREFLKNLSSASAAAAFSTALNADEKSGKNRDAQFFALLADTHIPATPADEARGVNMTDHFNRVLQEVLEFTTRPANLIVNGDCAHSRGTPEEYQNFSHSLKQLDGSGIDLHITMGNHDDRDALYENFAEGRLDDQPIPVKHVGVLEGEFANWFLVDTLVRPGISRGEIGWDQLQWLMKELDARPEKPAIIMAHHNPQLKKPKPDGHWMGIWDTDAFLEALTDRPHVRALMFGHTHQWNPSKLGDLHLINLPAVSYVFGDYTPSGWVSARLDENGMKLQVHALDKTHRRHGEALEIRWKA